MDELKKQIIDRYTATELVDLLDLSTEDIVESCWDHILIQLEIVTDDMGYFDADEEEFIM